MRQFVAQWPWLRSAEARTRWRRGGGASEKKSARPAGQPKTILRGALPLLFLTNKSSGTVIVRITSRGSNNNGRRAAATTRSSAVCYDPNYDSGR